MCKDEYPAADLHTTNRQLSGFPQPHRCVPRHTGFLGDGEAPLPFHRMLPPAPFADILPVNRPHRFGVHLPAPQIGNSVPHKTSPAPPFLTSNLSSEDFPIGRELTQR